MKDIDGSVGKAFFFGASPEIIARARALRNRMTRCEKILWQELRRKRMGSYHFRRQHPVSRFIVDFYCHELRLVIEVDGSVHDTEEQQERDLNRTAVLNDLGLKVVRFSNAEILMNERKVSARIRDEIGSRLGELGTITSSSSGGNQPCTKPPA